MSNVTQFPGIRAVEPDPLPANTELVGTLKTLLAHAESGEVVNFCGAALSEEGEVSTYIFCSVENYFTMYGALAEVVHKFPGAFDDQ